MNSGSSRWGSDCSSIAHFQWYREADVSHFCCFFLICCVFRPIVNSDENALRVFLSDSLFFDQFGSKKPTFAQIAKALLHQTPYFNFTIPFFNISLLFYFIFSQLPKYYTTKKHYDTQKISFLFPQLMNSGSLCSSIVREPLFINCPFSMV